MYILCILVCNIILIHCEIVIFMDIIPTLNMADEIQYYFVYVSFVVSNISMLYKSIKLDISCII